MHPRNRFKERYNFEDLLEHSPGLKDYVVLNKYGEESIDFFNPQAVRLLNKALLEKNYDIKNWDIPKGYLCPPIPGRLDYIHHLADLLSPPHPITGSRSIHSGSHIRCLDIGTGANAIYPLLGYCEYGWSFVGVDIDETSIESCDQILNSNPKMQDNLKFQLQENPENIFKGILDKGERFDATLCNPPFHASAEEAMAGSMRKLKTQKQKSQDKTVLSFGGQSNELWCEGGEMAFLLKMIEESKAYAQSCFWYTSLVSKKSHLKNAKEALKQFEPKKVESIAMGQGNKASHILAWTFLNKEQRRTWIADRQQ